MKFLDIINKYEKTLVVEQDAAPAADLPTAAVATEEPAPAQPEPAQQEPLDIPANVVTLSRMLKSALLMNISPEDEDYIRKLPEINNNNATSVVDKIIPIMTKYTPLDVDTNAGVMNQKKF